MMDDNSQKSLKDLDSRLRQARGTATGNRGRGPLSFEGSSGIGVAFRVASELVAGLVVGVGIGYGLDLWLDTGPWFLIVFFFLGAGAGIMNVYRAASGIGMAAGYRDPKEGGSDKVRPHGDNE